MDYYKAFNNLYSETRAVIKELNKAQTKPPEFSVANKILKDVIYALDVIDEAEAENSDPTLTPSFHGVDCLGNGEHEGIECCCDECDNYLTCFPNWKEQ